MPIQGLQFVIPTGTEKHQVFQATGSFVVYNPNDGVCFVALDRTADGIMWDHKVPSQSGGKFPGPVNSYLSIYYLDQSGGGQNGQVVIYPSVDLVDIPYFWSIGRALLTQATSLDIVEGSQPGNPGSGILRLWADGSDQLHGLNGGGTDEVFISTRTPLGGSLTGFLPNPSVVEYYAIAANSPQTIPTSVWTALSFPVVTSNKGGVWSAGNPTRFTAPVAGVWLFNAMVGIAPNNAGTLRALQLSLNGTLISEISAYPPSIQIGGGYTPLSFSGVHAMNVNDYMEFFLFQDSGGNLVTSTVHIGKAVFLAA